MSDKCWNCGALMGAFERFGKVCNECLDKPRQHAERCVRACEGLGDDPERAVRELVDALRKAHAETIRLQKMYHDVQHQKIPGNAVWKKLIPLARIMSGTLERHGLLRPCDQPERLPDVWKPKAHEPRDYPALLFHGCEMCGAAAGEPCSPVCLDRR